MRVNPNSGTPDLGAVPARNVAPAPALESDEAVLGGAEALNQALAATPEVRPEKVVQAHNLLANTNYPPDALINGLAKLLAVHLETPEAVSGEQSTNPEPED